MKKLLCLALTLIMIAALTVAAVPAGAEPASGDGVLIVTANGENATEVKVGNEFILRVGLNAGDVKILNGQVHMEYDPDLVSFDPYKVSVSDGEGGMTDPEVELYSFPTSINNSGIVLNYSEEGVINYNFTRAHGVGVFNTTDKLFARFRFKATAAGTTDISHIIQYMINVNEERLYYQSVALEPVNPTTAVTIEPSNGCVGDADGDYDVTILDATFMQRSAAGVSQSCDLTTADVTGDNKVSLKDVIAVRKYLAGKATGFDAGKWLFASES